MLTIRTTESTSGYVVINSFVRERNNAVRVKGYRCIIYNVFAKCDWVRCFYSVDYIDTLAFPFPETYIIFSSSE